MRKRSWLTAGILCGILLISGVVCLLVRNSIANGIQSARQAERWSGESEMSFVQLACYYGKQGEKNLEGVYGFRQKLLDKFTEEGMESPGSGELFCDAWSAMGKLRVSCDRADSDTEVLAVGGQFFDFHPMELLSGSYLRWDDVTRDRVVLDELLAWILFGSSNVAGMDVEINGRPFEIAGVVRQDDSKAIQRFRSDSPTLYMPFDTYQAMSKAGINCYEVVLPEPISGYGEGLVEENFPVGDGVLQQMTGRFSLAGSWAVLKDICMRGTQTQAVSLPYWENAARYEEMRCAMWLLAALILLALPGLVVLVALVWLLVKARKGVIVGAPKLAHGIGDFFYMLSGKLRRNKKRD